LNGPGPDRDGGLDLGGLAGLETVAEQLTGVIAVIRAELARKDAGLAVRRPVWKNLVFAGGPGSGKSRAAAAVGRTYRELGVLTTGHLTEVASADLADISAGVQVQDTARLVREAASRARGGILMINHAPTHPSLATRDQQVLRHLQQVLTDFRADLAVILAGPPGALRALTADSPALAARFPHLITFPRYTAAQLAAIFAALAGEAGFALTTAAAGKAAAVLEQADAGPASGGARLAVRLLDQATARQARRVTAAAQPLPPAALGTVEATDIPGQLQPHPFGPTDDPGPGQYL